MNWTLQAHPDRGQYRPGETASLVVRITGPAGSHATLHVRLTERARSLASLAQPVTLDAAGVWEGTIPWAPPASDASWRAFGADLTLLDGSGGEVARYSTAFDVAPHWRTAPRYGVLTEFAPKDTGDGDVADVEDQRRLDLFLGLHINCVQFYDWMYTHHTYTPPEEVFTDPLGRRLDFGRVRRRIAGCRDRGMAPVAYASVYGGEQPFAGEHPDWLMRDGQGQPMSLGGMFFIQDPSPECGWRRHLMGQYRAALDLGFVGLHCDTYGSPKSGVVSRAEGRQEVVHLEQVFPGLMAEAEGLAKASDPEGGAIFNCVGAWPLEAMARAPGAALYVEVWPPMVTYRDLYELVMRAHRLNSRMPIVLAAYLSSFHRDRQRPEGSVSGLRLASAAIFASGGYHLLPAEGDGVLGDAYYPLFGRLGSEDWEVVRQYWDFQTRYGPLLADPDALDITTTHLGGEVRECRVIGAPYSPLAEPGKLWTLAKEGEGYTTIHFINLAGVKDPLWNSPQPEPPPTPPLTVEMEAVTPPSVVWTASPDSDGGRPRPAGYRLVTREGIGQVLQVNVPSVDAWTMLVVEWQV